MYCLLHHTQVFLNTNAYTEQVNTTMYNVLEQRMPKKVNRKNLSLYTNTHNCTYKTTNNNMTMQCHFCEQTGVVEWTHATNKDPLAFDVCSDTHSCVPVSFTNNRFRAIFPARVQTIQIFETWHRTHWKYELPSGSGATRTWDGCQQDQNFISALQCIFSIQLPLKKTLINVQRLENKIHMQDVFYAQNYTFLKLYVVGDSNMKRLFD